MFVDISCQQYAQIILFFDAAFKKFINVDFPVPAGPKINTFEFVCSMVLNAVICDWFKIGFILFITNIMP